MFRFDFNRARVLGEIREEPDGMFLLRPGVCTEAESVVIPPQRLRIICTKHLEESPFTVVVDFGPEIEKQKHAVVAGGSTKVLQEFFHYHSNISFPGLTPRKRKQQDEVARTD